LEKKDKMKRLGIGREVERKYRKECGLIGKELMKELEIRWDWNRIGNGI
jgi:hypothetical protein